MEDGLSLRARRLWWLSTTYLSRHGWLGRQA